MRLENEHRIRNVSRDGETETTDTPGMDRSAECEDRTWMTEASIHSLSLPHPIESTCVGISPKTIFSPIFLTLSCSSNKAVSRVAGWRKKVGVGERGDKESGGRT